MKKIYTYIAVFALAALAAGCAKEIANPDDLGESAVSVDEATGESTVTVVLSVPESPDTKTTLGAKDGSSYPVFWSEGDVITLNGTAATSFTPASGNATATASFKVTSLASPYNFLYGGVPGQSNQVSFPSTQNYVEGGFDPAAMPMYASVTSLGSGVTFSHVGALLKFSFTGEKKIDSVTLTAADANMSLSGTFTIGATGGLLNGALTPAAGGATLIYAFNGHKQLSDEPFVFYIAIPAGTYEGGITLDILDNNSGHMTVKVLDSDATKTIAAGTVREFENVVYIQNKDLNLIQIYDTATLQSFAARVANGEYTLNARLTPNAASINASGISWTPVEDYKGTFDGNGKTISGLTQPLFGNLQGVVKNLTLDSDITETDATQTKLGMFARTITPSSAIDDIAGLQNCTASGSISFNPSTAYTGTYFHFGGLVGDVKGGALLNCVNNATVTLADNGQTDNVGPFNVGGIAGIGENGGDLKTSTDITNCQNAGTVQVNMKMTKGLRLGGVVGYFANKGCYVGGGSSNTGTVKVGAAYAGGGRLDMGGIIGLTYGAVENVINSGNVTSESGSTCTDQINQAGVIGNIVASELTYDTGIANSGTVNVAITGGNAYVGGVVAAYNAGSTLTGLRNSGNIDYSAASTGNTFIGGVIARTQNAIIDCSSTGGTISYTGSNAAGPLYVGGVTAYTNAEGATITNCTNAMTISVGGTFSPSSNNYYGTGGIIGNAAVASAAISNCLNTGSITLSQDISSSSYGYTYLGGVAGRTQGDISDSSNGGTVTFSGRNSAQNPYIGGVVGTNSSGNSITGKHSSAAATNTGHVEVNTSTQTNKYFYVGGVAGRSYGMTASNSGTITVTRLKCSALFLGGLAGLCNGDIGSGSINTESGDISIPGLWDNYAGTSTTDASSCIGGIAGDCSGSITAVNEGEVSITAGTDSNTNQADLYVGGIVGRNKGQSFTSCINRGNVSNAANSAKIIAIGGLMGWSGDVSVSTPCYNTGAISNAGDAASASRIGGLIGCASGAATLTSTDSAYNYNNGTVTDSSSSDQVCIGGICGWTKSGSTDLSYCRNLSGGTVTVRDGSPRNVYASGILAIADDNSETDNTDVSVILTCASNAGALNFTNLNISNILAAGGILGQACGDDTFPAISGTDDGHRTVNSGNITFTSCSIASALRLGGVWGFCDNTTTGTLQYCTNSGNITASDADALNTTYTGVNYTGGILGGGGSDTTGKTIQYCNNTGNITMNFKGRLRMGGIVSIVKIAPAHCTCEGTITYGRSSTTTTGESGIGGIAGYYSGSGSKTFSDLHFNGTVEASGSYCKAAALIGGINSNQIFSGCSIQGTILCAASNPGLFFSLGSTTKRTITCSSLCTVKKGTVVGSTTINSINDLTQTNVVGGAGTSTSLPISNLSVID